MLKLIFETIRPSAIEKSMFNNWNVLIQQNLFQSFLRSVCIGPCLMTRHLYIQFLFSRNQRILFPRIWALFNLPLGTQYRSSTFPFLIFPFVLRNRIAPPSSRLKTCKLRFHDLENDAETRIFWCSVTNTTQTVGDGTNHDPWYRKYGSSFLSTRLPLP